MSYAEIADNKWEVESTKPKIVTAGSIAQIAMMGGFALFFVYILMFSVIGMFSSPAENELAEKYKHMNDSAETKAKAAAAAAP